MGLFIVIGAIAVFFGTMYVLQRRNPEFRKAQLDWITLRDPLGINVWRKHWRMALWPLLATMLWLAGWVLLLEVTRGFGE